MNEERAVKADGFLPYSMGKRDLCCLLDVLHRSSLHSLPMSGNQPLFNEVHVCFNPFLQNVPGFLRRERKILVSHPFTLDDSSLYKLLVQHSFYVSPDRSIRQTNAFRETKQRLCARGGKYQYSLTYSLLFLLLGNPSRIEGGLK